MNRFVAATAAAIALFAQLPLASTASAAPTWSANGALGLTASTYTVNESAGSVTLSVLRAGGKSGVYSVTWKTENGTAVAGTNYTAESGTLTWPNGDGSTKTFTIPLDAKTTFSGSKSFKVILTAGANTMVGSPSNATVTLNGTTASTTKATTPPATVKSIKQWGVACNDTTDESNQLAAAIAAAANNAFELQIDCPVRFHTGSAISHTINIPAGVTIKFAGSGELLTVSTGATALAVANPQEVTFLDWNLTYL